ncbi:MAG: hypothetical protein AB1704_42265 [Pseudomonadota bacterium]
MTAPIFASSLVPSVSCVVPVRRRQFVAAQPHEAVHPLQRIGQGAVTNGG